MYKKQGVDTLELEQGKRESIKAISDLQEAADKKIGSTLSEQVSELQKQGMGREQMIAVLRQQGFGETQILQTIKEQTAEVMRQMNVRRVGLAYQDQSTAALEGVVARLKSQLDALKAQNAMSPMSQQNPFALLLQNEFNNASRELSLRTDVSNFSKRFGEDAARGEFGDTVTSRSLSSMKSSTDKMATDIETMKNLFLNTFKPK